MRLLLTNLLMLIFISSASAQTQKEIYYRPIKTDKLDHVDVVLNNDTIRFFNGEWVETAAKNSGDIVLGSDILKTDALKITDYKKRTMDTIYAPLNLTLKASYDTVEVTYGGEEKISCVVINQSCNKIIDTLVIPGKEVFPGLDSTHVLRFAPMNKASVIVNVSSIEGYGVPVAVPEPEPVDPGINPLYFYIGLGVVALLLVCGIVWFFMKRKRKAATNQSAEESVVTEGQPQDDSDTLIQGKQPVNDAIDAKQDAVKKAAMEAAKQAEIIRQYERELSDERKKMKKLADDNKALEERLSRSKGEIKSLEEKLDSIKDELKKQHEKEIEGINARIEVAEKRHNEEVQSLKNTNGELRDNLAKTNGILDETKNQLANTEDLLAKANDEIVSANKSLEKFTNILSEVPFAIDYAANVSKLLSVADEINNSAIKMLDLDLEDPYNIMKYISRYAKTLSMIDMQTLYAELKMLAKGNMVLVGSSLATYNKSNSAEDLKNSTIQYFFTSYLQKLVDGLVVLNESMAGADRLVDGVKAENVKVFANYRTKLQELCSLLGIVVENVCLFDKVGEKIDLRVELVDIGFSTGDIVDMENAIVYLQGARRPDTKVRVKAQE